MQDYLIRFGNDVTFSVLFYDGHCEPVWQVSQPVRRLLYFESKV